MKKYPVIPIIIYIIFNLFLSFSGLLVIVLIKYFFNYYFGIPVEVVEVENTILPEILENYNSSNILKTLPKAINTLPEVIKTLPEVINPLSEVINPLPEVINHSILFEEFEWKWRPMGKLYPYCNYNLFEFKQVELYWNYFDHLDFLNFGNESISESIDETISEPVRKHKKINMDDVTEETKEMMRELFPDYDETHVIIPSMSPDSC